jgi:anti-sigma regulatory factor (Ser/Thr protein kinase)
MHAQTLDLTLPPQPESVAEARSRVLDAVGPTLAEAQAETLRLLVSEVVTNAVRHGARDEPVEVHVAWGSEVRIDVIDRGHGFTPAPRASSFDEPGGFGLYLIGRLADRWGVETNSSTRVWFVLRRD